MTMGLIKWQHYSMRLMTPDISVSIYSTAKETRSNRISSWCDLETKIKPEVKVEHAALRREKVQQMLSVPFEL